ncbi:MAG: hypothetical protein ACLGI9_15425, partial [Thermoanaerobaculia bacterium]
SSGEGAQVIHLAGLLPVQLPKGKGQIELPLPALSAPAARIEVRLVLPGGREYSLEASRAGSIGPPPGHAARSARRDEVLSANRIAQQVLSIPGAEATASNLFPRPPGFHQIQAAWSALSPTPGPLAVRVENDKEDLEWF